MLTVSAVSKCSVLAVKPVISSTTTLSRQLREWASRSSTSPICKDHGVRSNVNAALVVNREARFSGKTLDPAEILKIIGK